jgi:hypothetical protein
MNEREFIKILQSRAREQEKLIEDMPMSGIFKSVSFWLGNHPWRLLIPISIILTVIFRLIFGPHYDNFILTVFGRI